MLELSLSQWGSCPQKSSASERRWDVSPHVRLQMHGHCTTCEYTPPARIRLYFGAGGAHSCDPWCKGAVFVCEVLEDPWLPPVVSKQTSCLDFFSSGLERKSVVFLTTYCNVLLNKSRSID